MPAGHASVRLCCLTIRDLVFIWVHGVLVSAQCHLPWCEFFPSPLITKISWKTGWCVENPLKNIRQLGRLFQIFMEKQKMFQTTNQKRSAASLREKTLTDQEQQGRLLTEPSLEENRQQTVETVVSEFQMHSTGDPIVF